MNYTKIASLGLLLNIGIFYLPIMCMEAIQTNEQHDIAANRCGICVDDANQMNEENRVTLSCHHKFHTACLEGYCKSELADIQSVSLKCPLCRKELIKEDIDKMNLTINYNDVLNFLRRHVTPLVTEQNMATIDRAFDALRQQQKLTPEIKHYIEMLQLQLMLIARQDMNRQLLANPQARTQVPVQENAQLMNTLSAIQNFFESDRSRFLFSELERQIGALYRIRLDFENPHHVISLATRSVIRGVLDGIRDEIKDAGRQVRGAVFNRQTFYYTLASLCIIYLAIKVYTNP